MWIPKVNDRVEWREDHKGHETLRRGVVKEIVDGAVRVLPYGLKNTKRVDLEDLVEPETPGSSEDDVEAETVIEDAEYEYVYVGDVAGAEGEVEPDPGSDVGVAVGQSAAGVTEAPAAIVPMEPRVIQIQQMPLREQHEAWKEVADLVDAFVKDRGLSVKIGDHDHLVAEAWNYMMALLNVFPTVVWCKQITDAAGKDGWESRTEWKTADGRVVAAGESQCTRSERTWARRDDYALRSQSQTRSMVRGPRLSFSFIIQLAGYNPTPADEMPGDMLPDPKPEARPQGGAVQPPSPVAAPPTVVYEKEGPRQLSSGEAKQQKEIKTILRALHDTCKQYDIPIETHGGMTELKLDDHQCACVGVPPLGAGLRHVQIGYKNYHTEPWSWMWPEESEIRAGAGLSRRQVIALVAYDPAANYTPIEAEDEDVSDVPF